MENLDILIKNINVIIYWLSKNKIITLINVNNLDKNIIKNYKRTIYSSFY